MSPFQSQRRVTFCRRGAACRHPASEGALLSVPARSIFPLHPLNPQVAPLWYLAQFTFNVSLHKTRCGGGPAGRAVPVIPCIEKARCSLACFAAAAGPAPACS